MDCISVEEMLRLKTAKTCLVSYSDIPNFASTYNVSSYYWIVYNSDQSFSWTTQVKGISDAMFDNNLTPKCIPDLSAEDCRACLKGARSVIPKSVPRECRVVHESCHLSYQFKNPDEGRTGAPPPPSPTPGAKTKGEREHHHHHQPHRGTKTKEVVHDGKFPIEEGKTISP
ncbi:hypothetical protein H5410_017791 [Solanum commersonii]|uniref:Gnk2-homologous domain-containing protein n=1 Tax=Solanum commersonii TaxID=4109 RepID=A0A9J6A1F6_SOLCO|nr:hypothetical protein H5410_017791 [Solanum commersonii]